MSHPVNRRERFLIGVKKGFRRAWYLVSHLERVSNPDLLQRFSRKLRKTTKLCSCPMCGNPRKYFNEDTMQQKRNEDTGL